MKRIVNRKAPNKFDASMYPDYQYMDLKTYFDNLQSKDYIKKNSYSIIYHAMFNLIGTHISVIKGYRNINISYGHVILLSYIMGFVKEASGFDSFFGSNATLANDLGVDSRTIQRWLRSLEDVGFIKVIIQFNTERRIYVNFVNIINSINRSLGIKIDDKKVEQACGIVTQAFIQKNFLEQDKFEYYRDYLIGQCNIRYCLKNEIDIKYLFSLMIDELDLKWNDLEEYYKLVNYHYIEMVANKK